MTLRLALFAAAGALVLAVSGLGLPAFAPALAPALAQDEERLSVPERYPPVADFDPEDEGEKMYRRGLYPEAIAYWKEQAGEGDGYAAYKLGRVYLAGQVVEQDFPESYRWQKRGSELNFAPAMFELGTFYDSGLVKAQNFRLAARWYKNSADRNYPPAQHNVATMFEDGVGVEKDFVEAYKYFWLARANGFVSLGGFDYDEEGNRIEKDPIAELKKKMSPEQVAAAEAAIEAWRPVGDAPAME